MKIHSPEWGEQANEAKATVARRARVSKYMQSALLATTILGAAVAGDSMDANAGIKLAGNDTAGLVLAGGSIAASLAEARNARRAIRPTANDFADVATLGLSSGFTRNDIYASVEEIIEGNSFDSETLHQEVSAGVYPFATSLTNTGVGLGAYIARGIIEHDGEAQTYLSAPIATGIIGGVGGLLAYNSIEGAENSAVARINNLENERLT